MDSSGYESPTKGLQMVMQRLSSPSKAAAMNYIVVHQLQVSRNFRPARTCEPRAALSAERACLCLCVLEICYVNQLQVRTLRDL